MYLISNLFNSRYMLRNRFLLVYALIVGVILYYVLFGNINSPVSEDIIKWKPRRLHMSCHRSIKRGAVPLLRRNATLPPKSIFFIETSCKGDLTSRQACSVEAAARAHPQHQINLLFTSAVSEESLHDGVIATLLAKYKNIKLARIRIADYAAGTPLSLTINTLTDDNLDIHIAKIMKYLTLYKFGGIFLGLDVVVARSLDDLWKNWAVRETPASLSTDMFAFSENKAGRKLAEVALGFLESEIANKKRQDLWSFNGPSVHTDTLQLWCEAKNVEGMSLSTCDDLAVYGPELFYPVSFHNRRAYFKPSDWESWKEERIYTYVIWQYFTKYNIVTQFSLYGKIAMAYCPVIYNSLGYHFGLRSSEIEP